VHWDIAGAEVLTAAAFDGFKRRFTVTVEAIFEASSQMLIESGMNRLSADPVAKRAGLGFERSQAAHESKLGWQPWHITPTGHSVSVGFASYSLDEVQAADLHLRRVQQALGGKPQSSP
jgi:hypothetical protein